VLRLVGVFSEGVVVQSRTGRAGRRPRRSGQQSTRRWGRWVGLVLLLAAVALNLVAFMQAHAMTHYSGGGQRTARPENLTPMERIVTVISGVNVPRPANEHTPRDVGLAYDTAVISTEDGGHLEAWHIPGSGSAAVVLMFPAYAESKESLLPAAVALNQLDYSTLLVDFQGVGGSSGDDTTLGTREARDVKVAFEYAHEQWPHSRLVLYGVSIMGAAAVLPAVAHEDLDPDVVILESPFDSLLNTVRNRFDATGLPSFPAAELLVFWGGVQFGFDGFAHNPIDYARRVRCPTLLLYGDRDPRVTPAQSMAIYDHIGDGSSYKQMVPFSGAGHEALVVADPLLWDEYVGRFLDNPGPAR
jgi:uncharacterized protein